MDRLDDVMFDSNGCIDCMVVPNFGDTCIDRDIEKGKLILADGTVFEG